jgi:hypothetical protein
MLEIGTVKGRKLKIWLDQGFGYWLVPRSTNRNAVAQQTRFRFNEPASFQGDDIAQGRVLVEGQPFATQIFIEKT